MTYDVTLVKTQTCVVRTEADSPMDALKYVQFNAQLGQFTTLQWTDKEIYGQDVDEV